jgi:hypothetical protein
MLERTVIKVADKFILKQQEKHASPSVYKYPDSLNKMVQKLPLPIASFLRGSPSTW